MFRFTAGRIDGCSVYLKGAKGAKDGNRHSTPEELNGLHRINVLVNLNTA